MCRNHQFVAIDGQKLTNILKRMNITKKALAVDLGYGDTYFTDVCKANKIRPSVLTVLEKAYGIAYEDIQPDPEPEPVVEEPATVETVDETTVTATLDYDILVDKLAKAVNPFPMDYDDIASAVRKGVTAAITDILVTADTRATIMELIKNAHKMALRENLKERIQEQGGKMR